MNPKLLDYDADGVPHTLITNMWQDNYSHACELPLGAPITQLPAPGNYLYRYKGPTLGWQLDIEAGLVTEVHNDTTNSLLITPKLLFGTQHSLIAALWNGIVETIDLDKPKTNNTTVMLNCTAADVHFGEGTGSQNNFYFLSTPPGDSSNANGTFNVDIYYAFNSDFTPPAAPQGLSVN